MLHLKKNIALFVVFIYVFAVTATYFITPADVYAAHSRVDLLTADAFAILAGSGISDTGATTVFGDAGLSPTGGTAITGLTCSEMTGTIYDTNGGYTGGGGPSTACLATNAGLLTQAKNDLITAYNDAAGRTVTATIGTELGGATLTDGTYDSLDGTFGMTGTLTLDGQGNADSVFIFKASSTFITASSSRVLLVNGAQACNVYWQVGSSATLGTGTNLAGNVLAVTSITDNGGSVVNGRLLAQDGAVSLNNTTVVKQTCSSGGSSTSSSGSSSGATSCPALPSTLVRPVIFESQRIDADSVSISWGPYSGVDTFIIRYGYENGNWLYSTNVTGFSTTINGLSPDQPIWVQAAPRSDCTVGMYGEALEVGGPILPNSGVDSHDTMSKLIVATVSMISFASYVWIRKLTLDKYSQRYYK